MLSGNGRHRRPRQAPALIVAAGVTGSAIAIPLLGATGASAADGTTWDRVAECESGGSWSADNANGYYGGLQMTQENWDKYGGLAYAPSPDEASRSQQIAVAEKVLDGQGLAAWPTCGPLSGLSKNSASVEVDTGVAEDSSASSASPSPDSSPSSDSPVSGGLSTGGSTVKPSPAASGKAAASGTPSKADEDATASPESGSKDGGKGDGKAAGKGAGKAKADDSDKSGQTAGSSEATAASGSEGTGTGRHRGPSADADASAGGEETPSGRHASRGSAAPGDAAEGSYTVRLGDSLTSIADSLAVQGGWNELYTENEKTVGADPDVILPGQSLEVAGD
ncbi:transglycosylase family protein [Streptomyces sp. NPDC005551]|uniref:transglycosylase family protein n=1 Tax=unclassified Streptomyces TaxID=2593676 RepID=UPI0033D3512D